MEHSEGERYKERLKSLNIFLIYFWKTDYKKLFPIPETKTDSERPEGWCAQFKTILIGYRAVD